MRSASKERQGRPSPLARIRAGAHRLGSAVEQARRVWGLIGGRRQAHVLVMAEIEYAGNMETGVTVRAVTLPNGVEISDLLEQEELDRLAHGSAIHWQRGRDEFLARRDEGNK